MFKTKPLLIALTVALSVLSVLFTTTNPDNIPFGLLVVPIVLLFFVGFCGFALLLKTFRVYQSNERKQQVLATFGGISIVFWIILQSSGGVTFGDIVLLCLIALLALFYISKY